MAISGRETGRRMGMGIVTGLCDIPQQRLAMMINFEF
jgi:hypothetical protein